MSELHYDTLVLRPEGMTRDVPAEDNEDLRWVANSATLIYGDHDAVLVDTFMTMGRMSASSTGSMRTVAT